MRLRQQCDALACLALMLLCTTQQAHAANELEQAATEIERVNRELQLAPPVAAKEDLPPTAAQRLAAAELMMRTGDHTRAIDELSQILELHRQGSGDLNLYVDALFLLGEGYFADTQELAARRQFTAILEGAPAAPYLAYAGRAAARLADIAVALQDIDALQGVLSRLEQLPIDASGSIEYARSKVQVARGDLMAARVAASHVGVSSKYHPQVQYLLGVIELTAATSNAANPPKPEAAGTLPEQYVKAVTQFQRVTQLKVETPEHRRVVDEAWLALGRIFYETGNYLDAADSYNHVHRGSAEYSVMLNELSWAYVRLGDYENALPLLETLSLIEADTLQRVDGALLRGDVLLRSEKDEAALQAYQEVRDRYEPWRADLASYLSTHGDPAAYYELLVEPRDSVAVQGLSSSLLGWVDEVAKEEPALAVARDNQDCRRLLRRSDEMVRKLTAALSSSARVRLFPDQRAQFEHWESLQNRLAGTRLLLAQVLDRARAKTPPDAVTRERQALMSAMDRLPRGKPDFLRRERDGQWQWASLAREVQRATLEANQLQALANGLTRTIAEQVANGRASDPGVLSLQNEVLEHQRTIAEYQRRIEEQQRAIDLGRVQIGLGDLRFINDRVNRVRFAELLASELQGVAQTPSTTGLSEFARNALGLLNQAAVSEQQVWSARARLDAEIRVKARALSSKVSEELRQLQSYQKQLDALEHQASKLLGVAAQQAVTQVEARLTDLVRRSDIAVAAQAWEARERSQRRVIDLQHARAIEEKQSAQDLQEILGEGKQAP